MKLTKPVIFGIACSSIILLIALALFLLKVSFFDRNMFLFVAGIALIILFFPFFLSSIMLSKREESINRMFLEFARDLVEGVKTGTPVSKSIMNVRNKDYGELKPFIQKLANQIELGIPVKFALETFAKEVKSPVISRAVNLIREAETSGGKIEAILESVSFSVTQIEKLRKERKAAIYNLTVQGYIIFLIFIAIMLVLKFRILTLIPQLSTGTDTGSLEDLELMGVGQEFNIDAVTQPFLYLLLAQGFCAGLVIGKMTEGSVKSGFKHSFILVTLAWIISTGAELVF